MWLAGGGFNAESSTARPTTWATRSSENPTFTTCRPPSCTAGTRSRTVDLPLPGPRLPADRRAWPRRERDSGVRGATVGDTRRVSRIPRATSATEPAGEPAAWLIQTVVDMPLPVVAPVTFGESDPRWCHGSHERHRPPSRQANQGAGLIQTVVDMPLPVVAPVTFGESDPRVRFLDGDGQVVLDSSRFALNPSRQRCGVEVSRLSNFWS